MECPEGSSVPGVGLEARGGLAVSSRGAGGPGPSAQLSTDPPRERWLRVGYFAQVLQLHDFVALIIHTAWSWV